MGAGEGTGGVQRRGGGRTGRRGMGVGARGWEKYGVRGRRGWKCIGLGIGGGGKGMGAEVRGLERL